MLKKILLLFLTLQILLGSCSGQGRTLEEEIVNIMNRRKCVGITALAVKNNKICYFKTFGYNPDYKDSTSRKPIPDNGVYLIASISKTFVSTAIMQLVEKKKLKLDDDVNKYLSFKVVNPNYPNTPITIRMLLSHRSSINDKIYSWSLDQINPETGKRWKECYNDYPPGTKYEYCNLAYNMLGAIIENVSGERFYDYIDNHINKPLEITGSYNLTRIDSSLLVKAYRYYPQTKSFGRDKSEVYDYSFYREVEDNYKMGFSAACFSPTGCMRMTAKDLASYMMMHMNYGKYGGKRIISKKSEKEMRMPQLGNPEYGLAFAQYPRRIKDVELVGMVGDAHGVHSTMLFDPNGKFGFIVICNGCTTPSSSAGQTMNTEIIQRLYKYIIKN